MCMDVYFLKARLCNKHRDVVSYRFHFFKCYLFCFCLYIYFILLRLILMLLSQLNGTKIYKLRVFVLSVSVQCAELGAVRL